MATESSTKIFQGMKYGDESIECDMILSVIPPSSAEEYKGASIVIPFSQNSATRSPSLSDRYEILAFICNWLEQLTVTYAKINTALGGAQVLISTVRNDTLLDHKLNPKVIKFVWGDKTTMTGAVVPQDLVLLKIAQLFMEYRVAQTMKLGQANQRERLNSLLSSQFGAKGAGVAITEGVLSNFPLLDTVMALFDFWISQMPDCEYSFLRAGTVTTFMKDSAVASRFIVLCAQEAVVNNAMIFAMDEKLTVDLIALSKLLMKPQSESVFKYMSALRVVAKNAYSATAKANCFLYLSIIAGKFCNPGYLNSRFITTPGLEKIRAMALLVSLYAGTTTDVVLGVQLENEERVESSVKTDQSTKRLINLRILMMRRLRMSYDLTNTELQKVRTWYKEPVRADSIAQHLSKLMSNSKNAMINEWEARILNNSSLSDMKSWDEFFKTHERLERDNEELNVKSQPLSNTKSGERTSISVSEDDSISALFES